MIKAVSPCVRLRLRQIESLHVAIRCVKFETDGHIRGIQAIRSGKFPLVCMHFILPGSFTWFMMAAHRTKISDSSLEQFILLEQEHRCLYDPRHPEHKDAIKIANIWASITAKLSEEK